MVLEEKKVKDICNFYVSDYHLEIMLLPYISKKIEEGEEIVIITEKNLAETLKEVINKTNINEDKRDKIINLGWNKQEKDIKINPNTDIILIGSKKFIEEKMFNIKKQKIENIRLIACYDYNEIKDNMQDIANKYDGVLNTLGIKNLK
mgnify:CR=1 FL=1